MYLILEGQRLPYTATCCNVVAEFVETEVVDTENETIKYVDKSTGKDAEAVYKVETLRHTAKCPNGCPDLFHVHEKRSTRMRAELLA